MDGAEGYKTPDMKLLGKFASYQVSNFIYERFPILNG